MKITRKHIGIWIIAAIVGSLTAHAVFASDKPTDFKAKEQSRIINTDNAITPTIQRLYCLPRIADLTEKKQLRTQLGESTEVEDNKIKTITEDCVGEYIKAFILTT